MSRQPIPPHDIWWLNGLSPEQIQHVTRLQRRMMYRKGEAVYVQGDYSDHCYTISEGVIEFVVRDAAARSYSAQTLAAGDSFCTAALLADVLHTASAVATEDVLVSSLSRSAFLILCRDDAEAGAVILRNLARRFLSMLLARDYQHSIA